MSLATNVTPEQANSHRPGVDLGSLSEYERDAIWETIAVKHSRGETFTPLEQALWDEVESQGRARRIGPVERAADYVRQVIAMKIPVFDKPVVLVYDNGRLGPLPPGATPPPKARAHKEGPVCPPTPDL